MIITDPSHPRDLKRHLLKIVFDQAWGLCVAYLVLGLAAEVLRRQGVSVGAKAQQFLDGIPYFAIRVVGQSEPYLSAVALGRLTPFWNRVLLSSITLGAIVLQAAVVSALVLGALSLFRKKPPLGPSSNAP